MASILCQKLQRPAKNKNKRNKQQQQKTVSSGSFYCNPLTMLIYCLEIQDTACVSASGDQRQCLVASSVIVHLTF